MGHNDFADSSRPVYDGATSTYEPDAEHGGLSALGEAAIQRINALGAVVDVYQLSREATLQVLDPSNLFLLYVCIAALKTVHELGHGYAACSAPVSSAATSTRGMPGNSLLRCRFGVQEGRQP